MLLGRPGARALATACWPMNWPTPPGHDGRTTSSRHRPDAPLPSASDIVPEAERQRIEDALADLVRQSEGRVATGFLGNTSGPARPGRRRPVRRGLSDAASPPPSVLAVSGRDGRHHGLGAVGCDPARRLDPPGRHGAAARHGGPGRRRRAHAQLQSLCLWGRDRLGLSTSRRSRSRSHPAGLSARGLRPQASGPDIEWARASVDSDLGTTAISWQIEPGGDLYSRHRACPLALRAPSSPPATDDSEVTLRREPTPATR